MKTAFFDIDNTLIYGDSLFSLIPFALKRRPHYIFLYPVIAVYFILYILKIIPINKLKEILYTPLKNFSKQDFEDFFDKYILGRKIESTFSKLIQLKKEGYYIVLVTASAQCYMQLFKERGYAHEVIGTLTKEHSNKIIGENCSKEEKVRRIKALNICADYESSVGFSDSKTDKPMLSLCKNRFLVKRNGTLTEYPY